MGLIEDIKAAMEMAQNANNAGVHKELIQIQIQVLELQNENYRLREEIRNLEEINTLVHDMKYKENPYWNKDEGPYCSSCWDSDKKAIRLIVKNDFRASCPICKNEVVYNAEKEKEHDKRIQVALSDMSTGYF